VPALDETQKPAFALRKPFWFDMFDGDLAARNKVNGNSMRLSEKHGGHSYRFGGGLGSCHTFNTLCSPDAYFATHPEYFSEVNGKRLKDHTQLCLSNPDVLRIVTSNVLARIRNDPGASFYGVSQNDWYNYCTCPACKALDDAQESHAGSMIAFVNQIAEARNVRLSENGGRHREVLARWKALANPTPLPAAQTRAFVEDKLLSLSNRGTYGDTVADPLCEDGSAMKLYNTHYE
jgi:hypothetical protein